MIRVTERTHQELLQLGKYGDTINDIVRKLINYYNFNHVLDILDERDREIIPKNFMQTLCELDRRAIANEKSNEFSPDDVWDLLGAYNKDKVYPIVEYFFLQLGYIIKHPNGKISLTNQGRKYCGHEFKLPPKFKDLII